MANDVIIEEYESFDSSFQAPTTPIATQVLDIGTLSGQLNDKTQYVIITSRDAPIWYKFGSDSVSAALETDGNIFVPANFPRPHKVGKTSKLYIDTATNA